MSKPSQVQKPSPGWAVELTGESIDLDDLRELLKQPFDPWVEEFDDSGIARLLLRSKAWAAAVDSSDVQQRATTLIERINGAKLIIYGDSKPVLPGVVLKFRSDGSRENIIVAATGHARASARARARAEVISAAPPPPPQASALQDMVQSADADDDRADLFEHLARADNWYDVYKSAEIIRRIAGSDRQLRSLLGAKWVEWERVWRTANCNRHAPDAVKFPPPPVPATFGEARDVLFAAARLVTP
jgi:hypothetical protein